MNKAGELDENEKAALKRVVAFAASVYDSMLAMTGEKSTALWAASQVMTGALGVPVTLKERPEFVEGAE